MILAIVDSLRFKENKLTQTVHYYENCKRLEFTYFLERQGSLPAVIADTKEEAIEKLREAIKNYLSTCVWGKPNAKDFVFSIRYDFTLKNLINFPPSCVSPEIELEPVE